MRERLLTPTQVKYLNTLKFDPFLVAWCGQTHDSLLKRKLINTQEEAKPSVLTPKGEIALVYAKREEKLEKRHWRTLRDWGNMLIQRDNTIAKLKQELARAKTSHTSTDQS